MAALASPPFAQSTPTTAALPLVLEPPRHVPLNPCLLTPGQIRIGSGPDNQIRLSLDGIAAEHAVILVGTHRVAVRAWDPRTWLNDGPVREAPLRPGDRLSLGPISFRVRRATADELLAGWPAPEVRPAAAPGSGPGVETALPPVPAAAAPAEALPTVSETVAATDPLTSMVQVLGPFVPALLTETVTPSALEGTAKIEPVIEIAPPVASVTSAVMTSEVVSDALPSRSRDGGEAREPLAEMLRQHAELCRIRQELDAARRAWQAESAARDQALAAESVRLSRQQEEVQQSRLALERRENQWAERQLMLDRREQEIRATEASLRQIERELADERTRIETLADETRRQLEAESARQASDWQAWERQQQELLAELAAQSEDLQQQQQALAANQARLEGMELALLQTRRELEHMRRDLQAERDRLIADRQTFLAEREAWAAQQQIREQQQQIRDLEAAERAEQLRRQQEQMTAEVRQRARAQAELQAAQQQLQHERRLFAEQQLSWQQERDAAWQELAERRRRLDADADSRPASSWQLRWEDPAPTETSAAVVETEPQDVDAPAIPVLTSPTEGNWAAESGWSIAADLPSQEPVEPAAAPQGELTDHLEDESEAELTEDDGDLDQERADVQAALDALAQRFEEFSQLEQRLTHKHDELRELQQDLSVREAALEADREALGLERAAFEAERIEWEEERQAWSDSVEEEQARRVAWEIARQAAAAELAAERQRWSRHLTELSEPSGTGLPPSLESPRREQAAETETVSASLMDALSRALAEPIVDVSVPAEDAHALAEQPLPVEATPQSDSELSLPREFVAEPMSESEAATEPETSADAAAGVWGLQAAAAQAESAERTPDLRSELARLFDLPPDFAAHHHEVVAPDEHATSGVSIGDAPDASAAWRFAPSDGESATSAEDLPSEESCLTAADQDEDELPEEDSIEAYMARLLARTRKGGELPGTDQRQTIEDAPASMHRSPGNDVASEQRLASDELLEPPEPRVKLDPEATRAELQSFRELANLSARKALATHSRKSTQTELAIRSALGLVSGAGLAFCLTMPWRGGSIPWGATVGCALATGWMGYRVWQTQRKLLLLEATAEPAAMPADPEVAIDPVSTAAAADEETERLPPKPDIATHSEPATLTDHPATNWATSGSLWDDVWSAKTPTSGDAPPPSEP
uniref:FHA domain-containing protein n=1 Tax=Schlesneria paludicola TaxID=360056 RepID=A0A7C2K1A8_9PLAN